MPENRPHHHKTTGSRRSVSNPLLQPCRVLTRSPQAPNSRHFTGHLSTVAGFSTSPGIGRRR